MAGTFNYRLALLAQPPRERAKRMRLHRHAWPIAALVAWASAAPTQPRQFELEWQAPQECPKQSKIEAEVLRLISPRVADSARMVARARVDTDAKGQYRLNLRTRQAGNDGERQFAGATCQAVADAAVVTLALSLDPNAEIPIGLSSSVGGNAPQELAPDPEEEPSVVPMVLQPRTTRVRIVAAAVHPETTHVVARAVVGGRSGVLPRVGFELGLGLGLQYKDFAAYTTLSMAPIAQTAESQTAPGLGGRFDMQSINAEACWVTGSERLSLLPCLGAAWFRVRTEGQNVVPVREGSLTWVAPQLGLGLRARVTGSLSVYAAGTAALALKRPLAYISPLDPVFQPDQVAYQLQGGVELRIW